MIVITLGALSAEADDRRVDVGGGDLQRAATVLMAEYGTIVSFEGVPLVVEGVGYDWAPSIGGGQHMRPKQHGLAFSYRPGASVSDAAGAAVAAWNEKAGIPATYRSEFEGGVVHLVPVSVATAQGFEPYVSPMETRITIDPSASDPTTLFLRILEALRQESGLRIDNGIEGFQLGQGGPIGLEVTAPNGERRVVPLEVTGLNGEPILLPPSAPPVSLSPSTGTARELLDSLVRQTSPLHNWHLIWIVDDHPRWMLGFTRSRPRDKQSIRTVE